MNKKAVQMSQEELTNKTIRRIYNRGKRKGYVSPEYIEKTIKKEKGIINIHEIIGYSNLFLSMFFKFLNDICVPIENNPVRNII